MKKALVVAAMMTGAAALAVPVSAQGNPTAGGSCGYKAGEYGMTMLSPIDIRNPNRGAMNVGTIHVQVEYSGVAPGTVLTIIPTSGSFVTGPDLGATGGARTVTAQESTGTVSFSVGQNENGAEMGTKNKGIRTNKAKAGRNSTQPSAGQSNGATLYFFQTWASDRLIGTFTCGVDDR